MQQDTRPPEKRDHSSGKNLQLTLAQLTLEIGDREKTIPLLENVVRETNEFHEKQYKDLENELSLQFERQSKLEQDELLSLLDVCDKAVESKKRLTLELQELLQRKKVSVPLIVRFSSLRYLRNKMSNSILF